MVFPIVGFEEMEYDSDFIVNGIFNGDGHCWGTNWQLLDPILIC